MCPISDNILYNTSKFNINDINSLKYTEELQLQTCNSETDSLVLKNSKSNFIINDRNKIDFDNLSIILPSISILSFTLILYFLFYDIINFSNIFESTLLSIPLSFNDMSEYIYNQTNKLKFMIVLNQISNLIYVNKIIIIVSNKIYTNNLSRCRSNLKNSNVYIKHFKIIKRTIFICMILGSFLIILLCFYNFNDINNIKNYYVLHIIGKILIHIFIFSCLIFSIFYTFILSNDFFEYLKISSTGFYVITFSMIMQVILFYTTYITCYFVSEYYSSSSNNNNNINNNKKSEIIKVFVFIDNILLAMIVFSYQLIIANSYKFIFVKCNMFLNNIKKKLIQLSMFNNNRYNDNNNSLTNFLNKSTL